MTILFYVSAVIALISAVAVVTRVNAMHALLYLALMFISLASVLWTLGAPFAAVLEIVVYAGAIMVLFVFVVMMLNLGKRAEDIERSWLSPSVWGLPLILALGLFVIFIISAVQLEGPPEGTYVGPKPVGISMFPTYLIGVELASLMLIAGLVAAFHYGVVFTPLEEDDERGSR